MAKSKYTYMHIIIYIAYENGENMNFLKLYKIIFKIQKTFYQKKNSNYINPLWSLYKSSEQNYVQRQSMPREQIEVYVGISI